MTLAENGLVRNITQDSRHCEEVTYVPPEKGQIEVTLKICAQAGYPRPSIFLYFAL